MRTPSARRTRRTRPGAAAPLLVTVAVVGLTACAAVPGSVDASIADRTYLGLPAEGGEVHPWAEGDAPGVGYARGGEPETVNVVTFGSSSCPMTPVDFEWDETDRTLRFSFGRRDGTDERPCTLDTMPSTSVVVVPGLPADEPVTIRTGAEDVVLPVER